MAARDPMDTTRSILRKLPLIRNGQALVGITFVIAGIFVGREGILRLVQLWGELSVYFPISLPPDVSHKILMSFPLIFKIFICLVGSLCATLVGLLWIFAGIVETVQSRSTAEAAAAFEHPDFVAEALRTAQPSHWASVPWIARAMAFVWPAAGFMSPVTYDIFRHFLRSIMRLVFWGLLVAVVVYLIDLIPWLFSRVLARQLLLVVPSAGPLYTLVAGLIGANILIALSLVPLRTHPYDRSSKAFTVHGTGDPRILFAMIEEGCRLLTPRGSPTRTPTRLQNEQDPRIPGTLIESFPTALPSFGKPAAYLCLPAVVVLVTTGFSRLVNFNRSTTPMIYSDFFSYHALFYALDVAFALGLVLCGLHLVECARKLFGVCRFSSVLVFCHLSEPPASAAAEVPTDRRARRRRGPSGTPWTILNEVDDQFAAWARRPDTPTAFHMGFSWAEAVSEAAGGNTPRHLLALRVSQSLDEAMDRILELPFQVDYRKEPEEMEPPERLIQE
jgi:hypothetical protein